MRRRLLLSCVLALLVVGCGAATPTTLPTIAPTTAPTAIPTPPAAPTTAPTSARTGDRLFAREGYDTPTGQLSVIDSESGARLQELPLGVAAPGWSTLYVTEWGLDQTTVRALDLLTGTSLRQTTVAGRYTLPEVGLNAARGGLSPNGRWLALGSGIAYEAGARNGSHERSRLVVLDTAFTQQPKPIELDGNFTFDALSNDGASLYLIETLPRDSTATAGLGYKVRVYDLNAGMLQPGVVVDKTAIAQTMSGTRQSAIASPDGQWVYSLYLNAAKGPFIHMLNLNGRYAICVFLPTDAKEDVAKQMLWSLAQTPDGRGLYAVNGALGIVADVDTAQLAVRRTASLPMAAASQPGIVARVGNWLVPRARAKGLLTGSAALTPDGGTLFVPGERGVFAVNTRDLTVRGRFLSDLPADSVTISPDGARLYVVSAAAGKMLSLDPTSGVLVNSFAIASHQPWVILGVR